MKSKGSRKVAWLPGEGGEGLSLEDGVVLVLVLNRCTRRGSTRCITRSAGKVTLVQLSGGWRAGWCKPERGRRRSCRRREPRRGQRRSCRQPRRGQRRSSGQPRERRRRSSRQQRGRRRSSRQPRERRRGRRQRGRPQQRREPQRG